MEIEAKFNVPNRRTYRELCKLESLAGFVLAPLPTLKVQDEYLDTPDRRILEAGYVFRLRESQAGVTATLKSIGGVTGVVHRREELEVRLPVREADPARWPAGTARELAVKLSGGEPLEPLFIIRQKRVRRSLGDGMRTVAEVSLDSVMTEAGGKEVAYYELEVELMRGGDDEDLQRIAAVLTSEFGLAADRRSKFQRAWEQALRSDVDPDRSITAAERSLLESYSQSEAPGQRRALVVLGWAAGLPTREISRRSGLSTGRVRHWVRAFRATRAAIFHDAAPPAAPCGDAGDGAAPVGGGVEATTADAAVEDVEHIAVRPEPEAAGELFAPIEPPSNEAPPVDAPPIGPPDVLQVEPAAPWPRLLPVASDDPMSEAARKVLLLHFRRMLENEAGTRLGEDDEALHDMRVATRRMRAAFRLFTPYLDQRALRPHLRRLRATGRVLGTVRDLDVLIAHARAYAGSASAARPGTLQPLLDRWESERRAAREQLVAYLDSGKFGRFTSSFGTLLESSLPESAPPEGVLVSNRVRNAVPRLLIERYEAVRAYEGVLADAPLATYHQLRIEFKQFRYALEFFRDLLGEEAGGLIKQVVGMQDLLGALQDAHLREGLITSFLHDQSVEGRRATQRESLSGVAEYLASAWAEQDTLLARFPVSWVALTGYDFRRSLGLAVAML